MGEIRSKKCEGVGITLRISSASSSAVSEPELSTCVQQRYRCHLEKNATQTDDIVTAYRKVELAPQKAVQVHVVHAAVDAVDSVRRTHNATWLADRHHPMKLREVIFYLLLLQHDSIEVIPRRAPVALPAVLAPLEVVIQIVLGGADDALLAAVGASRLHCLHESRAVLS